MSRNNRLLCLICAAALFFGCDSSFNAIRYALELPEFPPSWDIFPSQPHWKIEWLDCNGRHQTREIRGTDRLEISLPDWANAVIAWPFWPDLPLSPGVFMPAGALFPFDASGDALPLSWRGGVEAMLYRELGMASLGSPAAQTSVLRQPRYFNWPRFRELYDDAGVNAEFRRDPWLADWPGIAAKIWQSGFDKRRLVPQARREMKVPVGPGPWIGTSPFSEPLLFSGIPVFPVRSAAVGSPPVETWVSREGILRCSSDAYFFQKWKE